MRITNLGTALICLAVSPIHPLFAQQSNRDPFSYCRSVKNWAAPLEIEHPPKAICDSIGYPWGGPPKECAGVTWRCQDGEVYGCEIGASGRGCMRWNTSKAPTQSLRQYCAQTPNASVPNAVNDTPYSWSCRGKTPVLDQSVPPPKLDKSGYYADAWKRVLPTGR
jgi:hypothetical protein